MMKLGVCSQRKPITELADEKDCSGRPDRTLRYLDGIDWKTVTPGQPDYDLILCRRGVLIWNSTNCHWYEANGRRAKV